jgi:hypothetical protein
VLITFTAEFVIRLQGVRRRGRHGPHYQCLPFEIIKWPSWYNLLVAFCADP